MITEDYCSFEVAKLLKEKGFDECIFEFYEGHKIKYARNGKGFRLSELGSDMYYPHITHQMAMAWLRGKGIECVIIPIWNTIGKQYRSYVLSDLGDRYKDNYDSYSDNISYEEAVESALKYCLEKLI